MKLYKRHEAMHVEATPEDVVAAFQALDLPVKMRAAAKVLDAANTREGKGPFLPWGSEALNGWADRWEAEDAEKAKRDSEIEELIGEITAVLYSDEAAEDYGSAGTILAKKLFAAGYRKQATDE